MRYFYYRLVLIILLIISIFFIAHFVWPYIAGWLVILEFLNRRKEYTSQKNFKTYNLIFTAYVVFIFNRFVFKAVPVMVREGINRMEHVLFAFVLCLMILQFLQFPFARKYDFYIKLLLASLIFQMIGIVNELYQFAFATGHAVLFSQDTIHDLISNVVGNILFVFLIIWLQKRRNIQVA